MKKLLTLALMLLASHARAGIFYDNRIFSSSGTLRVGYQSSTAATNGESVLLSSGVAIVRSTSTTATHRAFMVRDNTNATILASLNNGGFIAGVTNSVTATYGSVTGGLSNTVSGQSGHIGGGQSNSVGSSSTGGFIGGGTSNSVNDVSDPTKPSVVGGGATNSAINGSTIGGGSGNTAAASSAIGGGVSNTANNNWTTVAGGTGNNATATASAIGGGSGNTASGQYSSVPGGLSNTAAGAYTFAAGRRAKVNGQGSFGWADSQDADLTVNTTDQMVVRVQGGAEFQVSYSSLVVIGAAQFGTTARSTITATGFYVPRAMTAAQVAAYTPVTWELGGLILCTNCASAYSVCQATGTTVQGLRLGTTGTTECK
jgi:hypothetical protein